MIETVFLDWGLAFGAGVLFAICGRAELVGATRKLRTRAFRWGLVYLHAGVLAISVTLYAMNRDWMWMYWIDPRRLPIGIEILAFVLYEVCFAAGFLLATELAPKGAWALAAMAAAGVSVLEITARSRLFHFGTLEQFRSGRAVAAIRANPLRIEPAWWIVSVAGGLSLVALVAMLRSLVRSSSTTA